MYFHYYSYMESFVNRLKDLMKEKDIENKELAKELHLSNVNRIYPWLNGDYLPSTKMVVKMSDFFECTIEYLLGRTEENNFSKFKAVSTFEERLKNIMLERKIRKVDMINSKICNPSNFTLWFTEHRTPQIETLIKLADYFKVTIDYLLGRE